MVFFKTIVVQRWIPYVPNAMQLSRLAQISGMAMEELDVSCRSGTTAPPILSVTRDASRVVVYECMWSKAGASSPGQMHFHPRVTSYRAVLVGLIQRPFSIM